MIDQPNWANRVNRINAKFTRIEEEVLIFITDYPHEAAFMSLKEMCDATGISKPKIIDFYRKLGYPGYKQFRQGVKDFYAHHIDAYKASCTTFKQITTMNDLVKTAVHADITALQRLAEHISIDDLKHLAQAIIDSSNVYLFGLGTGTYPVHYLSQRLKRYRLQVQAVRADVQHLLEEIYPISKGDLLLVFYYFPERDHIRKVMEYAKDQGARIFLISGTVLIDFVEFVERSFYVERGSMGFKNSMAVPMCFSNLLLLTIELLGGEKYQQSLKEVEDKREQYGFLPHFRQG